MKRVLCIALIVSLLIISSVYAAEVNVQINGEIINFEDANAQIINDRTMVPFRKIFNELGISDDAIEWDGDTKTIIAKKNDTTIKLQIGNNEAEKIIASKTDKIILDSAPVIRNDRTLVPLRFIAESLGKTVGWDNANKTAVIIDFDYFSGIIKAKSNAFYNFLVSDTSNMKVNITRNYYDLSDSTKNDVANVSATIEESNNGNVIHQKVDVSFSGTNELMQDINSEGWSNISYENEYYDEYFTTKALTEGLKKVYGQEQLKFKYGGLKCEGKPTDSIADLLKTLSGVNDSNMNVQTFSTIKGEINDFINLFNSNASGGLTTGNISSEKITMQQFDITKLDSAIYDSTFNRVFSLLNSQIFNFDVTLETLIYDYPKMNMSINVNNLELTIDFVLSNDYNEKVEYVVKINK